MKRNMEAFTLIELLVVIAIIALLLSILMPSLRKVKDIARRTVCTSNVKQIGLAFYLYAEDNNDSYTTGPAFFYGYAHDTFSNSGIWYEAIYDYYENLDLIRCPTTTKSNSTIANISSISGDVSKLAWPRSWMGSTSYNTPAKDEVFYVSYGMNRWACNPPKTVTGGQVWQSESYWRKSTAMRTPSSVPLLMDCIEFGGRPSHRDKAPKTEGAWWESVMSRFCVDRHRDGYLQAAFADNSVRGVGLKELWKIKWSRDETRYPRGPWPDWMEGFKEY